MLLQIVAAVWCWADTAVCGEKQQSVAAGTGMDEWCEWTTEIKFLTLYTHYLPPCWGKLFLSTKQLKLETKQNSKQPTNDSINGQHNTHLVIQVSRSPRPQIKLKRCYFLKWNLHFSRYLLKVLWWTSHSEEFSLQMDQIKSSQIDLHTLELYGAIECFLGVSLCVYFCFKSASVV